MSETWQQARLIPTSGITGPGEAERRATSALLAVMGSVREFGTAITKPIGAPVATLETYIEVPFTLGELTVIPDGLIRATRGSRTWTTLVEVKTGTNDLARDQIENYLDVAREQTFDAVLTISNQIAPAPGVHPVDVDRRKLKKVALHHLSWAEILTAAVRQRVHHGVSDPDQAWILGELIRYLEHPKSGALDFADMGAEWVTIREAVAAGTLRPADKGLAAVVSRWDQLLRFAALRLGRELGADVELALTRKEQADPSLRLAAQSTSLAGDGRLTGTIRIPDAVGALDITADLRGSRVIVSVDLDAPRDGRAATRVNWLTRQLKDAPAGLRIDAWAANQRTSTSELLGVARDNPAVLIADPQKDLRQFRVAAVTAMGTKRGTGRASFIDSVLAAVEGFYGAVLQQLRPWTSKAPQLPAGLKSAAEAAGIDTRPSAVDLARLDGSDLPADEEIAVEAGRIDTEPVDDNREVVRWDLAEARLEHERRDSTEPDASDQSDSTENVVDD